MGSRLSVQNLDLTAHVTCCPNRPPNHLPLRPKFASNVFLSSPEDGGLVLAMIAPVTVRVPNDGGDTVAEVCTHGPHAKMPQLTSRDGHHAAS